MLDCTQEGGRALHARHKLQTLRAKQARVTSERYFMLATSPCPRPPTCAGSRHICEFILAPHGGKGWVAKRPFAYAHTPTRPICSPYSPTLRPCPLPTAHLRVLQV